ncbi:MAG TPA: GNAT family N-acetyltransferase [Herpetosiphonaceae bacterium]|nr:GNAT family N-acetyltransferase [Herpetosiphonaceae bacterium]
MSHPDFAIRPFTPADQVAARDLVLDGLGEHFGWIDPSRNPDVDDIAAHYLARGHLFVVAHIGETLVGTGALIAVDEQTGRLVRMSVHRRWRRRGLGRALVAHLIAAARERGYRRVVVETNKDWWDAIVLYRQCGFHEYDVDEGSVYLELDLP